MHARLGSWISRNAVPWHTVVQLVSVQNETLLWLVGMNYAKM